MVAPLHFTNSKVSISKASAIPSKPKPHSRTDRILKSLFTRRRSYRNATFMLFCIEVLVGTFLTGLFLFNSTIFEYNRDMSQFALETRHWLLLILTWSQIFSLHQIGKCLDGGASESWRWSFHIAQSKIQSGVVCVLSLMYALEKGWPVWIPSLFIICFFMIRLPLILLAIVLQCAHSCGVNRSCNTHVRKGDVESAQGIDSEKLDGDEQKVEDVTPMISDQARV